jgi:hypothetical protein
VALYHAADALDWLTVLRCHALYYVTHSIPSWLVVCQFGFDFGGPGTFLGDVLAFIQGEIVAAISFLFNLLVAAFNYLLSVAEFIFKFFLTLARDIKNAFKWLWTSVVKVGLTKLVSVFVRVQTWLAKYVNKIVGWLVRLRKWYDQYFNQVIKPVLNAIRHLRQVLQIFRLLGFKWAARLDARLAQIENRLVAAFELLRVNLNRVVSYLQIIADPFGIFRRNPLLAAVIRDAPEMKNAIDRATNHVETQKELDSSNTDNGWFQIIGHRSAPTYYGGFPTPHCPPGALEEFLAAVKELTGLSKQNFTRESNGL